jgi:ribosomal protein S18 acetylase RimI-like enzyme
LEQLRIVQARLSDIPLLHDLGAKAFYPTYLPFISKEQVDYMFHMMYDPDRLLEQMEVRGDQFFIVYQGQEALGFASCQLDYDQQRSAKLHKLYVLPEQQVKGLGKALLLAVEQFAQQNGQKQLVLNVNRYNSALGFYLKMGYAIFKEEDIPIGAGYFMNDYEMKKSLR